MHRKLDHPEAFGAGFTQGPGPIPDHWSPPAGWVLQAERPWVPCTLLAAAPVRAALAAGRSFVPRYVPNEIGASERASTVLAARWGAPWAPHSRKFNALPEAARRALRHRRLDRLRWARRRYYNTLKPSMVFYDTAADVHEHLRFDLHLLFAGLPVEFLEDEVHHYSGVSRFALVGSVVDDLDQHKIRAEVVERLCSAYGYTWADS